MKRIWSEASDFLVGSLIDWEWWKKFNYDPKLEKFVFEKLWQPRKKTRIRVHPYYLDKKEARELHLSQFGRTDPDSFYHEEDIIAK